MTGMLRIWATGVAMVVTAFAYLFVSIQPAMAEPTPECKTVVTQMTNRPDNGNGGVWATDTLTRTAEFCRVDVLAKDTVPVESWNYIMKANDVGTFVTLGGPTLSPAHKQELKAGLTGKIVGKFQITFRAPANWLGFKGIEKADGATSKTGDWAKAMWADGYVEVKGTHSWEWTYTTCAEKWVEAEYGSNGDITTKTCPSASASVSSSKPPAPSASGSSSAIPAALPLTGFNAGAVAVLGSALLGLGVGLVLVARKRRNSTFRS